MIETCYKILVFYPIHQCSSHRKAAVLLLRILINDLGGVGVVPVILVIDESEFVPLHAERMWACCITAINNCVSTAVS